jgi:hypothetical protein
MVLVVAVVVEHAPQATDEELVVLAEVMAVLMALVLQPLQILVVAVVEQEVQTLQVTAVVLAVQVMHELLIGVNYGTTLCIS